MYSDNHGETWTSANTTSDSTATDCQMTPLGLGDHSAKQLLMLSNTPTGHAFARSNDSGCTWSADPVRPSSLDPQQTHTQASILSVIYNGVYLDTHLYLTQPRSLDQRNVSLYHSVDGGRTWKADYLLWSGPSAGSSLAYVEESYKIACLFECGSSRSSTITDVCLAISPPLV